MVMRRFRFEVEGRGCFPTDMLRYDSCWPYSGQDVDYMEDGAELRTVQLECWREARGRSPLGVLATEARWASFGWRFVRRVTSIL